MNHEVICNYDNRCGENPLWHAAAGRLFWTDIPTGRLFWYDPLTGEHQQCYEGRDVGGFTVQHDGTLLLFRDEGNIVRWWDGRELDTVLESVPQIVGTRWNDVIADPRGRVFGGSIGNRRAPGVMARVNLDGTVDIIREGVGVSNGMGFTPDGTGLYYTDTPTRHIELFDFNEATGELSNPRVVITVGPESTRGGPAHGSPDGMICAADGRVFTALWGGGGVAEYRPDGTFVSLHELPAKNITSLIAAPRPLPDRSGYSDELVDFYVTSAGGQDKERNGEHAGALFKLNLDAAGQPEHVSRLPVAAQG